MKKILINEQNRAEIQKMIDAAHTNKMTTCLMTVDDILENAKYAEQNFKRCGIPKRLQKGMVFCTNKGERKANAYKYKYGADYAELEFTLRGWALTMVTRTEFYPNSNVSNYFELRLKNEKKEAAEKEIKFFMYKYLMDK